MVVLINVVLLLYIMHNWLAAHRFYLAVCFGSISFSVPPSLRLFIIQRVRRFAAPIGLHRILDACVFKSFIFLCGVFRLGWFAWWRCVSASGSAHGFAVPYPYYPGLRRNCTLCTPNSLYYARARTGPRSAQRLFACMCGPCRISCSQLSGRSFGESLVLQPLPQI